MLTYYGLFNESQANAAANVTHVGNIYTFNYPCTDPSTCTDYNITLSKGLYRFELFGASGGSRLGYSTSFLNTNKTCVADFFIGMAHGNAECHSVHSIPGAGGYVSGYVNLSKTTKIYATIGGKGQYKVINLSAYTTHNSFIKENMVPGGYGGGGSSSAWNSGTGSGGGQTAVKFLENDMWHRVIVSGGGGGTDDLGVDDGSGGAGGNLTAQGFFINGVYNSTYLANSNSGFTFGQGEAAIDENCRNPNGVQSYDLNDIAGAGGGWFGGFSSHNPSGGAGGGSSWVLTEDAFIPSSLIEARDEFYENPVSNNYAFNKSSEYVFYDVAHAAGVWDGNGKLVITIIGSVTINMNSCANKNPIMINFLLLSLFLN